MLYRQLEVFRAVMDLGTATAAAQRLEMSQPAVSQHLAQLEGELDIVLFVREHGRLSPTEQAHDLYDEVAYAFEGLERVTNLARNIRSRSIGTLRIAVPYSMCEALVPRMLARFAAENPDVRYAVEVATYETIVAKVAAREVDLGVARAPLDHPGLSLHPILDSPAVCALPENHPLTAKKRLDLIDLVGVPLIMIGRHRPWRHEIDTLFRKHNQIPNVRLETHAVGAACGFVASGIGVSIVPEILALQFLHRGIVLRPLQPALIHQFVVAFPTSLRISSLAERFADDMRAVAAEYITEARAAE